MGQMTKMSQRKKKQFVPGEQFASSSQFFSLIDALTLTQLQQLVPVKSAVM